MDIEEDIEKVKKLNNLLKFFKTHGWIPNMSRNININGTIEAIEHILAEREEDKKKINKLEYCVEELKKYNKTISDRVVEYKKNRIPKQKVINSINYYDERIKHAKLIKDKEQEELYIYIKRAFYKLLEDK